MKPLAIDLYCGLGGWADGLLSEGFDVIGFDIERHDYGTGGYPGQLVIQDVLTLHGSQFKDAAVIVASPPCQEFSYMAMPWSRAKAKAAWYREDPTRQLALTALFDSCFRIQREASEAAGRFIPLVVENVKGAQPWVGGSKVHYGSFYLWGDVARVGSRVVAGPLRFGGGISPRRAIKNGGGSWFAIGSPGQANVGQNPDGRKVPGLDWSKYGEPGYKAEAFNATAEKRQREGRKVAVNFHEHAKTGKPGRSFQSAAVESFGWSKDTALRDCNSKSPRRKAASAQIAKIPFPLSQHIARCYKPDTKERVA